MKKFLLVLMAFMMTSCGSIPQDFTPAPIDNNLRTLELSSCNKRDVGILGCQIKENGVLEIPLWHKGEYQIRSNRCGYFKNATFDGNQTLKISYKELLELQGEETSCVYDILVFIEDFDRGFRGEFMLVDREFEFADFTFMDRYSKDGIGNIQIREGSNITHRLWFQEDYSGTIFWEGCQNNGEKSFEKHPVIMFKEIISSFLLPKDSCILTIGIIPDDENIPVKMSKLNIKIFDKPVVALPDPSFYYDGDELEVRADKLVAAISIGNDYKIQKGDSRKRMDSDVRRGKAVYVRMATSNGRYGLYLVKNGRVVWKSFFRY